MNLTVLLFAAVKDHVGDRTLTIDLPADASVNDVRQAMIRQFPEIAELLQRSAFAVGHEYVHNDFEINTECEIACIPPVSGG